MIKVIIISFSFLRGGAAIAANNFYSLIEPFKHITIRKISQDESGFFQFMKRLISWILIKLQFDNNSAKHSLNLFTYTPVIRSFKKEKEAIFHFHWINNDTLSIYDLKKIPPYSIITLHDEWLYCGAEHYHKFDISYEDFIYGYSLSRNGVFGIHWNYLIWKVKMRQISNRTDLIYTVPSSWMYDRASNSKLLIKSMIYILPNCIDTEVFSPCNEFERLPFRKTLSLEEDDFVITFGAIDGMKNPIKGSFLLLRAIKMVYKALSETEKEKVKLISFGGSKDDESSFYGLPVISVGHISDKFFLAKLYSYSDLIVVPSYMESFGQVAAESLSCSTPVVCFKTSGLTDIVIDGINGFMAEPFSEASLSKNILRVLKMPKNKRMNMGEIGRNHIIANFSLEVVREKYLNIIEKANALKKEKKNKNL